jgi:hypothetical protein
VRAVFPMALDRGGQGVAVVAEGCWPAKLGRDALKVNWNPAPLPRRRGVKAGDLALNSGGRTTTAVSMPGGCTLMP